MRYDFLFWVVFYLDIYHFLYVDRSIVIKIVYVYIYLGFIPLIKFAPESLECTLKVSGT